MTGEIYGKAFVQGTPNDSTAVEDMKRAQNVKLSLDERVTLLMDPLGYGHIFANYDHFIVDQDDVSPQILSQFAAMLMANIFLLRFDEMTKMKDGDESSRPVRDQSLFAPV